MPGHADGATLRRRKRKQPKLRPMLKKKRPPRLRWKLRRSDRRRGEGAEVEVEGLEGAEVVGVRVAGEGEAERTGLRWLGDE